MVAGLEENVLWVLLNNKELWLDRMPELIHAEMPTTLLRQRFLLVVNYSVGGWRGLSTVWNGSSGTKSGLINFQLVDKPTALVAYVLLSRIFWFFWFFYRRQPWRKETGYSEAILTFIVYTYVRVLIQRQLQLLFFTLFVRCCWHLYTEELSSEHILLADSLALC